MEHLLLAVIAILLTVIFALLGKIHLMHKSVLEIEEAFETKLAADTNTLIDISSRDPYLCRLASSINTQLRILRKQRHRYLVGDRELKEAVTNISHDLRTPLTAICGYLDLLHKEPLSENAVRYLSLFENRTEAMKQLTEELFRYSVILSTQELEMETVCLNGVLEESIAAFYGGGHGQLPLPGYQCDRAQRRPAPGGLSGHGPGPEYPDRFHGRAHHLSGCQPSNPNHGYGQRAGRPRKGSGAGAPDRKSTRLNSSHWS